MKEKGGFISWRGKERKGKAGENLAVLRQGLLHEDWCWGSLWGRGMSKEKELKLDLDGLVPDVGHRKFL